ncbi:hypothetical protein [Mesorhizobium silamurunense]|uniref:hypothetical protein n=1 Tax=Mesorhizobium silamurunense TaxID=499528 RepID=UPI00177DBD16|nr:hypothetical protein [Mesorhizobium silamurunense]
MHEPAPPRAFGKFGAKARAAVAAEPARSKGMENVATRVRAALSSHGPLALRVYVALWIVAVLASAFVIMKP